MGIGEGRVSPNDGPTGPHQEKDKMQTLAAAPRARADDNSKLLNKLPLPPCNNNGLMMEVWASVASWFFRPDAPHPSFPPGHMAASLPGLRGAPRPPNPPTRPAGPHYPPLAPTICTAIRCTVPGCTCECFAPGKTHIRFCDNCTHGWVPHALDKLGFKHLYGQTPVEPVQPNVAFDIASLVLYGTQALPIRLKILLDRLFSVLQRDEVLNVLHGFGWTHEDYARGYILQEPHGGVLERWNICSPEEEPLVLQQFLRFGETRAITQQLLLAQADQVAAALDKDRDKQMHHQQMKAEADLKRLIEKSALKPLKLEEPQKTQPDRSRTRTVSPPVPIRSPAPPATSPIPKQSPLNFKQNGPASPPNVNSSPISVSPLNRLQSMQPFDFRKVTSGATFPSGDSGRRRLSGECSPTWHLPPPLPIPPTSSSAPVNMSHSVLNSSSSENKSPKTEKPSISSDDDDDDDENSALNLSRDGPPAKPKKLNHHHHHRKGVSPVKRGWGSSGGLPLNLGTQLINPATGKKRVQCNVCLKTFCDKGALKIHFSAVHLREMHKCTVEGCNMMFSSRRSRNRHSANPNPKLHSPHLRRKISPHDGRSAQSHPLLMPPHGALSLPGPLSFGAFPLLTPPPELRHQTSAIDLKQSLDLTLKYDERREMGSYQSSDDGVGVSNSDYMEEEDEDYEGIVVVGDDEGDDDKASDEDTKRPKNSVSDGDDGDSNEDSLSVVDSQSVKECEVKRGRKRKSQNPTKCSQPYTVAQHDGMSSDGETSADESKKGKREEEEERDRRESNNESSIAGNPLQRLESLSQSRFGERRGESLSPSRSRASSMSNGRDSPDENVNEGYSSSKRNRKPTTDKPTLPTNHPTPGFHPDFLSRLYSVESQLGAYHLNGGDRVPLPFGFPGLNFPPAQQHPFTIPNGNERSSSSPASPASPVSNGNDNSGTPSGDVS